MNRETIRHYHDVAIKIYDREEIRRDGVERQALTLLGVTGLISSLWMSLGQSLLSYSQKQYYVPTIVMSAVFALILVAFLFAILFAMQALRRIPIHLLLPEEVVPFEIESEEAYLARLTTLRIEVTNRNYSKTNWKVRHLKRAQRCFNAGVAGILFGGLTNIYFAISNLAKPWLKP